MDISTIENAIKSALASAVPALKSVTTYAGELEQKLGTMPTRLPAAYVVYGGSNFSPVDGSLHNERIRISVLIAARSLRGSEAARHGVQTPTPEQGAYELVDATLAALANKTLSLSIEPLRPTSVELIMADNNIAIYSAEFETSADVQY